MTPGVWTHAGGDLPAAARAVSGALLDLSAGPSSPSHTFEDALRRAWEHALALVPAGTVGRRAAWAHLLFIVPGERPALLALGRTLRARLADLPAALHWHILLTAHDRAEPERTFMCDPGYDLAAYAGRDCLAWVTPYPGPDWRESQRYPTFEPIA
jgi:hypothetical protein